MSELVQNSNMLEQNLDLVWDLINKQQAKAAMAACEKLNRAYPNSDDGWFATSFLAFQLRNGPLALQTIEKAVAIKPANVRWALHKAHILTVLVGDQGGQHGQYRQQALGLVDCLCENESVLSSDDANFCAELALVLNMLSCHQASANFYQQAIDLTPQLPSNSSLRGQLYFNLASIKRYLGDMNSAVKHLDIAISLNPSDSEAYLLRSSLSKQTPERNHIAQLRRLVTQLESQVAARQRHPLSLTQAYYALAKEQEDLLEFQSSFNSLQRGASLRRKHMRYDPQNELNTLKTIINVYDKTFFSQQIESFNRRKNNSDGNQDTAPTPIFILGLPRTGSTLIERIVSSHSDVHSFGELNHFAMQMMQQVKDNQQSTAHELSPQSLVRASAEIDFTKLGKAYLDSVLTAEKLPSGEKPRYFVDKLPLNSLYVGLIHLALPNAKIIHVQRHPLDTCYAIYKQLFTSGYPFSYDINELAQYYIAHHQLMSHWQNILPGVMHQVRYEDVVEDVQAQAQALIAHCDLDWQPSCASFEKNTAPSITASASQVRQGIYKSSKYRWQRYQQQLQPIKDALEKAGISCDIN